MTRKSKLYGHRWRKIRAQFLAENPLCVMCQEQGHITAATELDHIIRHKGDPVLFYDVSNLQGLCADHHRRTKARMERSGETIGCDVNGTPLDPNHPWNQGRD